MTNNDIPDQVLTFAQVRKLMSASRYTVLGWIRSGRLRAWKVPGGRIWRINSSDLARFQERKGEKD